MKVLTILRHPQEVIGKRWRADQPPEQARVLGLARDALCFVASTGQHYPFEDFRESPHSAPLVHPRDDDFPELEERLRKTEAFFTQLLDEPDAVGEERLIQVILDTLRFISATGQYESFSQYLEHLEAGGPPHVVAAFDTRQEAQSWLDKHPAPPRFASVLIGNDYHAVMYDRETNFRRLPPARSINYYLVDLEEQAPPVATAAFTTHEEAEAWLKAQPAPARREWVLIGSELYLAAYHPNVNHRALYPLSLADGYRDEE
ncbi:hypothetical protein F0U59_50050 [Archangium gephyra]|nr:hypothetical protein F0U59_50050 [Archangium gephyra]